MTCNCEESLYIDRNMGHAVTGNLCIIKDRKLQKLIAKDLHIESKVILIGILILNAA